MIDWSIAATSLSAAFSSRFPLITPCQIHRLISDLREPIGANPSALLRITAARWPDRTAIIDDAGALTYRALLVGAQDLAAHLRHEFHIQPGSAVAVMCRNGRGFVRAIFGACLAGADVVLLNTDFTGTALASSLESHSVDVVLADEEFTSILREAKPTLRIIDPTADAAPNRKIPPSQREVNLVVLTSGTTGVPKGVPRRPTPGQVLGVTASVLQRTKLRTGDMVLIAVPFFHSFGLGALTISILLGATVITRRKFDAETALALASLHQARAVMLVPIMLARILDLPEQILAHNPVPLLQVVMSGGSSLEPSLATRALSVFGPVLFNGYGSSEVGIGAIATPKDLLRSPGTVGKPVAGSPMRVLDEHDRSASPGVVGRIFVGGKLAFRGYTGGASKPVVAGLTATGDRGYVDEFGCLHIIGREDDMIVSGGENVYPQSLENAIAAHPDVLDTAAIGVPDREYGQRLAAFVVVREDCILTDSKLRDYLRHAVARFEQPRDIWFINEIPRNPTGKALKKQLSMQYIK